MSLHLKLVLFIYPLLIGIDSLAQEKGFRYGIVNRQELGMKFYPLDSSAVAVVLNEFGVI